MEQTDYFFQKGEDKQTDCWKSTEMPTQLKESIRQTTQVGGIDTLESIPAGLLKS